MGESYIITSFDFNCLSY